MKVTEMDCRPEFIDHMNITLSIANDIQGLPLLMAPFVKISKTRIAEIAGELGVPIELTRSCYNDGPIHCGTCSTCCERRESLYLAGVPDPTEYAASVEETEAVSGISLTYRG